MNWESLSPIIGGIVVYVTTWDRFNVPTSSWSTKFNYGPPTTRFKYYLFGNIYAAMFGLTYCFILATPEILKELKPDAKDSIKDFQKYLPPAMYGALVLALAPQKVPLKDIDDWLRKKLHDIARIPTTVVELRDQISNNYEDLSVNLPTRCLDLLNTINLGWAQSTGGERRFRAKYIAEFEALQKRAHELKARHDTVPSGRPSNAFVVNSIRMLENDSKVLWQDICEFVARGALYCGDRQNEVLSRTKIRITVPPVVQPFWNKVVVAWFVYLILFTLGFLFEYRQFVKALAKGAQLSCAVGFAIFVPLYPIVRKYRWTKPSDGGLPYLYIVTASLAVSACSILFVTFTKLIGNISWDGLLQNLSTRWPYAVLICTQSMLAMVGIYVPAYSKPRIQHLLEGLISSIILSAVAWGVHMGLLESHAVPAPELGFFLCLCGLLGLFSGIFVPYHFRRN